MEMNGQFYALVPYSRERTLVPIEHEAGWAPEPFRTAFFFLAEEKIFCPRRDSNRGPSSPFASRYTDWVERCRYTYF